MEADTAGQTGQVRDSCHTSTVPAVHLGGSNSQTHTSSLPRFHRQAPEVKGIVYLAVGLSKS